MKHIRPERMTKEVRLLWETAELHDLKPRHVAPYVGVGYSTVYKWYLGQRPFEAQREKIMEAVKKIDAEFFSDGMEAGNVSWGASDDAEDAQFRASIRPVFYRLQAACTDAERRIVAESWPGFVEILGLLKKYDLGFPRRTK